jgi:uncharacterized protein YndB with AHSA1/START domain
MADIQHRIGITAPAERVYEALATKEGLTEWWTTDVRGEDAEGGELQFFFGRPEPGAVMKVTQLVPDRQVGWHCVRGAEEWVGSDLSFDLASEGDETVVVFTHANWREPTAFFRHCSTKWAYFLLELKAGIEDGKATPYPNDKKISSWG